MNVQHECDEFWIETPSNITFVVHGRIESCRLFWDGPAEARGFRFSGTWAILRRLPVVDTFNRAIC